MFGRKKKKQSEAVRKPVNRLDLVERNLWVLAALRSGDKTPGELMRLYEEHGGRCQGEIYPNIYFLPRWGFAEEIPLEGERRKLHLIEQGQQWADRMRERLLNISMLTDVETYTLEK